MTTVASNTILSSTSSFWTLIIGAVLKIEKFSFVKLLGVLLTFGGVTIVSIMDSTQSSLNQKDSIIGDLLALFSAFTYAIYVTWFKKSSRGSEENIDAAVFLGFLGLFNAILGLPILFILSWAKWEILQVPSGTVWASLIVSCLLGTVLSDFLWLQSILYLSPVIATVGISLTIPVAFVSDLIFRHAHFSGVYVLGSVLVITGFLIVNIDAQLSPIFSKVFHFLRNKWQKQETESPVSN